MSSQTHGDWVSPNGIRYEKPANNTYTYEPEVIGTDENDNPVTYLEARKLYKAYTELPQKVTRLMSFDEWVAVTMDTERK